MAHPLNIIFIWHMHQPSYNVDDELFLLPWTRLHATKDYYGMAKVVQEVENFKCTFNFTPVLWNQIHDYNHGHADKELYLIKKAVEELTDTEKSFLIKKLITGYYPTMIEPYPRYRELYKRIMSQRNKNGDYSSSNYFSNSELRDLIVWRILAWIDPVTRKEDSTFNKLMQKERQFSEVDKQLCINKSLELISEIPGIYKILSEKNRIEVSTTPYYHPILPLLIDSDSAKEALPHLDLPFRLLLKDDAEKQIKKAIESYDGYLGTRPRGFWPAEGSVSMATADLFIKNGVRWIATDEDILSKSAGIDFMRDTTGQLNHPDLLYRPYSYENDSGSIKIFFRDHLLSDLLGFEYQNWNMDNAVDDFINRLSLIHKRLKDKPFQACVPIILDGENAWEYYPDGGYLFLRKLFKALVEKDEFILTTPSEFLENTKNNAVPLSRLTAGSWINGNFGIWIGHQEENAAWNLLKITKEKFVLAVDRLDHDVAEKCHEYILKAEASDWFWWYGDDHYCDEKHEFDQLFRNLLINVFQELGEETPSELKKTLLFTKSRKFKLIHPKMLLSPKIDGRKGGYYDWFGAGDIKVRESFGAMHASGGKIFQSLKFGFDLQKFYLRLNFGEEFEKGVAEGLSIVVIIDTPKPGLKFELEIKDTKTKGEELQIDFKLHESIPQGSIQAACLHVFELAIPFKIFNARRNDKVNLWLELYRGGRYAGRIPDLYGIEFNVPTEDYDNLMWEV